MAQKSAKVEEACKNFVKSKENVSNCNIFVIKVADALGVGNFFSGLNADMMVAKFSNPNSRAPFHYIGKTKNLAMQYADRGYFILGGLTKGQMNVNKNPASHQATMGHVVIVAPGGPAPATKVKLANGVMQPARGGYPYCYQGAHDSAYQFTDKTQVSCVFSKNHLDDIVYGYVDVAKADVALSSDLNVKRLLGIHVPQNTSKIPT